MWQMCKRSGVPSVKIWCRGCWIVEPASSVRRIQNHPQVFCFYFYYGTKIRGKWSKDVKQILNKFNMYGCFVRRRLYALIPVNNDDICFWEHLQTELIQTPTLFIHHIKMCMKWHSNLAQWCGTLPLNI